MPCLSYPPSITFTPITNPHWRPPVGSADARRAFELCQAPNHGAPLCSPTRHFVPKFPVARKPRHKGCIIPPTDRIAPSHRTCESAANHRESPRITTTCPSRPCTNVTCPLRQCCAPRRRDLCTAIRCVDVVSHPPVLERCAPTHRQSSNARYRTPASRCLSPITQTQASVGLDACQTPPDVTDSRLGREPAGGGLAGSLVGSVCIRA